MSLVHFSLVSIGVTPGSVYFPLLPRRFDSILGWAELIISLHLHVSLDLITTWVKVNIQCNHPRLCFQNFDARGTCCRSQAFVL